MADIDVYGYITADKWDDTDVSAKDFISALRAAKGEDVTIHINSGGGDTMEAAAMAQAVRGYKGHVTASIEGLAASAASYFALEADSVVMNPSAFLMIHNPSGVCMGTAADMRDTAELLDKVRGTISAQYAKKTGMDGGEIESLMDAETWFTAEEALERGFVDSLTDAEPIAACITPRVFAKYKHAPSYLRGSAPEPATGEVSTTITKDNNAEKPDAGAAEGETGAVSKVVCVNGQFLNQKE